MYILLWGKGFSNPNDSRDGAVKSRYKSDTVGMNLSKLENNVTALWYISILRPMGMSVRITKHSVTQ